MELAAHQSSPLELFLCSFSGAFTEGLSECLALLKNKLSDEYELSKRLTPIPPHHLTTTGKGSHVPQAVHLVQALGLGEQRG